MIDLQRLRNQLATMPDRANQSADAEAWGKNHLRFLPADILPRIPSAARAEVERLARMAQSIGARIVGTKRFGTIGEVNWGGGGSQLLDDEIRKSDPEALANVLLEQSFYTGMMAGVLRRDPETEDLRMEAMLGHVEPVHATGSPTQIVGIVHAWKELFEDAGSVRSGWVLRVYDLHERTLHEWRNIATPADVIRRAPDTEIAASEQWPDGAPMPRFAALELDGDHLPRGEIAKVLPLIKSDWSSQLRADRAEENTAFPQLKIRGEIDDGTDERSSAHILRLEHDGDADFLQPGDLTQLHEHHNRKLERIREDAAMPGGFLGAQTPSGEALREANAKFIASCKWYANRLSRVMTELVQDLAVALDEQPGDSPEVTVQINREFARDTELEFIKTLHSEGLLPHDAAVRAISVYVPTWPDEEVERFINEVRQPQLVRPGPNDTRDALL